MINSIDIKDIRFNELDEENKNFIRSFKIKKLGSACTNRLIISIFVFLFITVFQCIAQVIADKELGATIIICVVLFVIFNFINVTIFFTKSKMVEFSDDVSYVDVTVTKLLGARQVREEDLKSYRERKEIWKKNHKKEMVEYRKEMQEWNKHYKKWSKQNAAIEADPDYLEKTGEEEIPYMPKPMADYSRPPKLDSRRGFKDSARIPNYLFFQCEQGQCTSAINVASDDLFNKIKVDDKVKIIKTHSLSSTKYDVIPI